MSTSRCRSKPRRGSAPPIRIRPSSRWESPTPCSSGRRGPTHALNTDFSGFKWAYRRRFGALVAWFRRPVGCRRCRHRHGDGAGRSRRHLDADLRHRPRPFTRPRPILATPQRGRRGHRGDVGDGGGGRGRWCGQRDAGGDVLPAGHSRRADGDRRPAMDLRRDLLTGRNAVDDPGCRTGARIGSAVSTCSSARASTPSRSSPATGWIPTWWPNSSAASRSPNVSASSDRPRTQRWRRPPPHRKPSPHRRRARRAAGRAARVPPTAAGTAPPDRRDRAAGDETSSPP